MKKTINITVADPAGNITIFVKDRFDRKYYPTVANQLLDIEELKGEQVAYIHPWDFPVLLPGQSHGQRSLVG